mmetsp:Transcript_2139/g.6440  ORF Transcript_2139/g.6440 Transcript_2139/m.6440 type:complete len:240 (-) Transcript_2139:674-1393(-)
MPGRRARARHACVARGPLRLRLWRRGLPGSLGARGWLGGGVRLVALLVLALLGVGAEGAHARRSRRRRAHVPARLGRLRLSLLGSSQRCGARGGSLCAQLEPRRLGRGARGVDRLLAHALALGLSNITALPPLARVLECVAPGTRETTGPAAVVVVPEPTRRIGGHWRVGMRRWLLGSPHLAVVACNCDRLGAPVVRGIVHGVALCRVRGRRRRRRRQRRWRRRRAWGARRGRRRRRRG